VNLGLAETRFVLFVDGVEIGEVCERFCGGWW